MKNAKNARERKGRLLHVVRKDREWVYAKTNCQYVISSEAERSKTTEVGCWMDCFTAFARTGNKYTQGQGVGIRKDGE
jgi:hypothetical protein